MILCLIQHSCRALTVSLWPHVKLQCAALVKRIGENIEITANDISCGGASNYV